LRYRLQLLLRPLNVLLHSCPARRHLLLEISVTSVGVEERKLLLNHANETVERFHQRVTLLFASLAVGVVAAFLAGLPSKRLEIDDKLPSNSSDTTHSEHSTAFQKNDYVRHHS
jgi:hypothetical protein